MSKPCSFAQGEPKTGNYITHTRTENMNNSMLLNDHKIKPTHSLEEAQLTDTKNKEMFFTWISEVPKCVRE